jgi:hypothetical protein
MSARTARRPHRTLLAVEQLEGRDLMSVAVSVVVPGGHHLRHRRHHGLAGVSVQVHVGSGISVGVNVSVPGVGVNISV